VTKTYEKNGSFQNQYKRDMLLWNTDIHLQYYTVSQTRTVWRITNVKTLKPISLQYIYIHTTKIVFNFLCDCILTWPEVATWSSLNNNCLGVPFWRAVRGWDANHYNYIFMYIYISESDPIRLCVSRYH
jgi:hypothetical protein